MGIYQLHWQNIQNMICTQDHGQYLTNLCFLFIIMVKELITHYCDSIHNRKYQNFYYRDSTITQPYLKQLAT